MKYDDKRIENEVKRYWEKYKIPEKIVKFSTKKPKFYLLDGPPYANAEPHVGHVKTTVFKDIWGKFKFMQGYSVWFQPGFDCHGLPIENAVEKKLNVKNKKDIINKIGVDEFIKECKKHALKYEKTWLEFYKKIGAWRGFLKPYLTLEKYYIESAWWSIKKIFEKKLLIEGEKPGYWCPHCETVLSGYEVSDSYKNLEDPSIYIKFPIVNKEREFILAWTTTPWTLNANVALAVHPDEQYVKVSIGEEYYILAKKRLEIFEKLEIGYKIVDEFSGKKLNGLKYKPILDTPLQKKISSIAHRVILSIPLLKTRVASKISVKKSSERFEEAEHLVTMDMGTGVVHIAPGHGEVDNKIGKHYNLPDPSPVDDSGKLTASTGRFKGLTIKEANEKIIDYLNNKNLLLVKEKIVHSYPLCWRCKTPLIYRKTRQWFLKLEKLKKKILTKGEDIKWLPNFMKDRFVYVINEAPDWAIARQRFWGIPLPIWKCEKCNNMRIIESKKELELLSKNKIEDLHKNVVDKITFKCSDCGNSMKRVPDILDVWFDSGIAPWASLGYPYKNKMLFETLFPVDLIDESQDQIRGWFFTLMICGMAIFDRTPYKVVCVNGWTLDEHGRKMSKSLGNVITARDAYEELGADVLRLYISHEIAPYETQKFSIENAKEFKRKLNILLNLYNYFITYCKTEKNIAFKNIEDKWIYSRINSTIKDVSSALEKFEFHIAIRKLMKLIIDDFSRTYVRLVRERDDKGVNSMFTYFFDITLRLLAPFAPFISDFIYSRIFNTSVHLEKWPKVGNIYKELEKEFEVMLSLISAMNTERKRHGIKLRWPLMYVKTDYEFENEIKHVIQRLGNVENVIIDKSLKGIKFEYGKFELSKKVNKEKALFREFVRLVQQKRKEYGLVVNDKIVLYISDKLPMVKKIKEHVGAEKIVISPEFKEKGILIFNNKKIKFSFKKI